MVGVRAGFGEEDNIEGGRPGENTRAIIGVLEYNPPPVEIKDTFDLK